MNLVRMQGTVYLYSALQMLLRKKIIRCIVSLPQRTLLVGCCCLSSFILLPPLLFMPQPAPLIV